jgi:hypothetical protein
MQYLELYMKDALLIFMTPRETYFLSGPATRTNVTWHSYTDVA